MFRQKKSPVKKKFATVPAAKKRRRQLDPRTVVLIKQGVLGMILVSIISILLAAVWYGTRVEFLTIRTVTVSGGETIDHEEVKTAVDMVLDGLYAGFIPRRFAWLYPETEVFAAVEAIPRVKAPIVDRQNGTTLAITFDEYIPHALWCKDRESDECYFIDDNGYSFVRAPSLKGGAYPRFHTIGTEAKERTTMLPVDHLRSIEKLRETLSRELELPIAFVETDIVRDVFFSVAGGGEIKATLRMSPEETLSNLSAILNSPEFSDITPGSFQYIDLRFGNKVFVNEEEPSTATTTASTSDDVLDESSGEVEPVPEVSASDPDA